MNKEIFAILAVIIALGVFVQAGGSEEGSSSLRIVNIVNFIRQCEPRIKWITEDVL